MIRRIEHADDKKRIARAVLEALPDWFGIPESRERYIAESEGQIMLAAFDKNQPVGFLCLKETGKATVELAVMGVLKPHHRCGYGRKLVHAAQAAARQHGYAFMQVKTVQMGRYEDYDRTNAFYLSMGFQEFEVFPTLWDEENPCQVYIMGLR